MISLEIRKQKQPQTFDRGEVIRTSLPRLVSVKRGSSIKNICHIYQINGKTFEVEPYFVYILI